MVFNVVILSPHGYVGQANVLGLPDTGGQVRKHQTKAEYSTNILILEIPKCFL
jgi:hypothetical protein